MLSGKHYKGIIDIICDFSENAYQKLSKISKQFLFKIVLFIKEVISYLKSLI